MSNNSKRNGHNKRASKGGDYNSRESSSHYPSDAIEATPIEIKVYGNNFEKALKAFRALVQKERILSDFKEKQVYEKPSDKRRRKRNEAKRKSMENDVTDDSRRKSHKSVAKPRTSDE
jgi:small subunit ribosomal protein S21